MKIIFKIAKAELRSLFYSPVAWVVSVAFFIVSSIRLLFSLELFANIQDYNKDTMKGWSDWGNDLSAGRFGDIFEQVVKLLYIFIPLLTMGIINKEVNAGTIKLLYSSPVRSREIVAGKFLGLMTFITAFAIPITLSAAAVCFSIKDADYNIYFSGMLGFYLLAGAYVSIGLFISCLTNYQIVAGVLTFVAFFILHAIGGLWQQYDLVRDLTYFLSISGRANKIMSGLLTTRDVSYFLLIIALFLSFSMIKLRGIKEAGGWRVSFTRYLTVSIVVLLLGYFSSRPGYIGYADVTRGQRNTIHPVTRGVVAGMGNEPLKVTLYTNLLGLGAGAGLPQNRNSYIWDFWDRYIRFHPNIQFEYVYYYDLLDSDTANFRSRYPNKNLDEIAEEAITAGGLSTSLFKTPAEIRSMIDLNDEGKRLVMQLEYKGKKTFLRTFPSSFPWPEEIHVSGSISRLLSDTVPLVLFTSGHYERSPYRSGEREYTAGTLFKLSQDALINQGVDVDTLNLAEKDIPANTNILVVADPRSALSPLETDKIKNYLNKGGNAIFYGEPGKQEMLNPILNAIGVHLDNGTIVYLNDQEMPHILISPVTSAGTYMAGEPFLYYNQLYPGKTVALKLVGSAAISTEESNGFKSSPIFSIPGSDAYWIENGVLVVDSAKPQFSQAEGDLRKDKYVTGVKMSRLINGKEQRIVVTGDADFMSDSRDNGQAFKNAAYSWALYNEYPKYTNRPKPTDNLLTINGNTANLLFKLFIYVLPAIIIILGTIILIRRSRK
jgi:ABC-2 type transport system permease protein